MFSEGYGSCCVCVSVCVSVKSHLILEAFLFPENAVTYSAGDEGLKICGVFWKLLRCRDRVLLSPLDSHTYGWPFFLLFFLLSVCSRYLRDCYIADSAELKTRWQ